MSRPAIAAEDYWVVIPAYNEGTTVRDVAVRARCHCLNVIVVDDGSTDSTLETLAGLDITVLRNERNAGKAASLWRGFQHALAHGAVAVITLDADGQHAPEEIPSFLTTAFHGPGAFLIGARRSEQRKSARCRYVANRVADFWISWAAGQPIEDTQSGFRLYPARFLRHLTLKHGPRQSFVFESEVLIEAGRLGLHCLHIPIDVAPRTGPRPSHFRPVLDIARITAMVGWKILQRGLYLRGLMASIRSSPANLLETSSADVASSTSCLDRNSVCVRP
jgi:glycosyltransferase involved in cell wall biosynthesis